MFSSGLQSPWRKPGITRFIPGLRHGFCELIFDLIFLNKTTLVTTGKLNPLTLLPNVTGLQFFAYPPLLPHVFLLTQTVKVPVL